MIGEDWEPTNSDGEKILTYTKSPLASGPDGWRSRLESSRPSPFPKVLDRWHEFLRLMLLAFFLAIGATFGAAADESTQIEEPYATWARTAEFAQDVLERREASTEALEELRARLAKEREAAFEIIEDGSVKVRALEAQRDALGPPPADGETEADDVAARRDELNAAIATANAPILTTREAYERADLLISELDKLIREKTTTKLLERSPAPIIPTRWLPALGELIDFSVTIKRELSETLRYPAEMQRLRDAAPFSLVLLGFGAALILLFQPFAANRLQRAAQASPSPWRRLACNLMRNLVFVIAPSLGAAAIIVAIRHVDITPNTATLLVKALPAMAAAAIFAHWLGRSLFTPVDTRSRVLKVDDSAGGWGHRLCQGLGLVFAVEIGFQAIQREYQFTPTAVAVFGGAIITVGSTLLWGMAHLFQRSSREEASTGAAGATASDSHTNFTLILARLMQVSAVLAVVFAAIGYVELSREALFPMITSMALIGFAYFAYRVIMRIIEILTGRDYTDESDGASLMPIVVVFVLSLALLPLIALAWGARTADISEVWRLLIDGVEFGDTRISLEGVIKLVVVFGVGLVVTRWLQRLLKTTVLPRTRLDAGGQSALTTGVGYVGITLSALIAVSAAGLNLSNLTVVFGALSIGIGFGMQQIVSNFVSGIILLIERPIKEGDWIEVAGFSGFVRKISVRSTRIETFDRHDVIVPNSELIAGAVKNMTLSSKSGRTVVPVGVAYGSDLEKTRQILFDAARANPLVARDPEPTVMFMGLGESSLDFELRCILTDVGATLSARSDMLFQIYVELGKAGIEIPFPQRDIHLRDIDRLIDAISGLASANKRERRIDGLN